MDKLLSVVIPTFNRKVLTDKAVQSVIATNSPECVEIIVVDDCGAEPYLFDGDYNRSGILVRVMCLDANVGAGMARQAGVDIAQGEYVAFLDSDDTYDDGWIDWVLAELQRNPCFSHQKAMISGVTVGERYVGKVVRNCLYVMPKSMQLFFSKLVTIMFNPFYTPSIVQHRELCFFKKDLRYCEDYYSTSMGLFQADMIILPSRIACHLGREPNSIGGASASKEKMKSGEMEVRLALFREARVPLLFRILVPFGMIYQAVRIQLKQVASILRKCVK